MKHPIDPREPRFLDPLERARAVSRSLAEAARRARFSSRARGAYQNTSFHSRRGEKAMRLIRRILFVVAVAIPNAVSLLYFGVLASDQFVSETRFTVSSGAIPKMDGLGSVTGLPPMAIVQDTMVISNFIESRRMVEQLEHDVGLRDLYGSESVDWLARFKKTKSIEKFTDYWQKMVTTSISFPGGILTVEVRAFDPRDAERIMEAVVSQCETLVNSLNNRMRQDAIRVSEEDLRRAAENLKAARVRLEQARNSEGIVDVRQTSATMSALLSELQSNLLKKQSQYDTKLRYVAETAPQMALLKAHIGEIAAQIDELKKQLTTWGEEQGAGIGPRALGAQKPLAGEMTKFATLDLEQQIAEKRYAAASAAVEAARMLAERQMLYLHQVVAPTLPEEARYPKRTTNIVITLVASLALWGTLVGATSFVRNHMA